MNAESISHYRLLCRLGHGGMSEVYEALDVGTERRVALKVLLPHLCADPVIRERFVREGRIGMQLDHPGIVRILEADEAEGRPYLAMEFVDGTTLEQAMNERRLDLGQCLMVVHQIADALAAAHGRGIVHRDIKPRNIMLVGDHIKLMDFGLARVLAESSITGQREIVGTLHYMSPEQALGNAVDARSDVFSIGVVFYHLLSGSPPFAGEHPGAVIHAILHSDPMRMAEFGLAVPVEVEQVVFKALCKQPHARYQSAAELRSDIEAVRSLQQGRSVRLIATEEVFEESTPGVYSELVGREQEMALLTGCLTRMLQGEGTTVLVSGEAGIGKSRLVWELGRRARRQHARYMLGRCRFGERGYPYQPLIEVLRGWFGLKGVGREPRLGAFLEERAPHLSARKGLIQALLLTGSGHELALANKDQLWDTVAELVKLMARDRPAVLHMDDLHWADSPTLDLLAYLAMNTRSDSVMTVGTYRPEELADVPAGERHPLERALELLAKEGLSQELRLERLDRQGTQGVVDSVFSGSRFPDRLYDSVHGETEGNPLFVLEVLKYLREKEIVVRDNGGWKLDSEVIKISVPGRVTDVIRNRLDRLSHGELEMLQVAAVEGYAFQSDTVCEVLGLPRLKVLRRLQSLETSHHLVHARENEYQFDHGKIQETVYNDMTPELGKELHRLVAGYYTRVCGEQDEHAGRIARHLVAARKEREALPYLLRAGGHARKLYANEDAIRDFDAGLAIVAAQPDVESDVDLRRLRFELLRERAAVLQVVGRYDEALADYQAMEALARALEDKRGLSAAALGIGSMHAAKGDNQIAIAHYERALVLTGETGDRSAECAVISAIGDFYRDTGQPELAEQNYRQAIVLLEQIGDKPGLARTLRDYSHLFWSTGRFEAMLEWDTRAAELSREAGDQLGEMLSCARIGTYHFCVGSARKCLELSNHAADIARRFGFRGHLSRLLAELGKVYTIIGDSTKGREYIEQALAIIRETGSRTEDFAFDSLGEVYISVGDFDRAMKYLQQAYDFQERSGDMSFRCNTLNNMGYVHFLRGDYGPALARLTEAMELGMKVKNVWALAYSYAYLCILWVLMGAPDEAGVYLEGMRKMNEVMKSMRVTVPIRIFASRLEASAGRLDRSASLLDEAERLVQEQADETMLFAYCMFAGTELEIRRQNLGRAMEYARRLLDYSTERGRVPDIARAELALADVDLRQADLVAGAAYATRALETATQCGMKETIWQARHVLGKVYMKNGDLVQARAELKQAEDVVRSIVEGLSEDLKRTYLARTECRDLLADLEAVA